DQAGAGFVSPQVPTVAIVEGVKIQFYAKEHPPAHFHAVFAEYRAQISIDSLQILKGSLPPAKVFAVVSWAEPRRAVLWRAWHGMMAKRKPEKIP
ncbi:MAG: DUF4160 domain-containing protein, partial [Xanthobacteraceae bacterium]